jgi:acetyltransferase-like isoleucine patch superfamily enzyme
VLGDCCVVAANAVVTRDVAAGAIVAGVPAAALNTASGANAVDPARGGPVVAPIPLARA